MNRTVCALPALMLGFAACAPLPAMPPTLAPSTYSALTSAARASWSNRGATSSGRGEMADSRLAPALRKDPHSNDWVIVAPARGDQPHEDTGPIPYCPFCPGKEA